MKPFNLYSEPLHSRMIIEASAGTGKTYAITRVLVRLLLESDITIDKILVVTFTRMAVRELRERVHRVLHDALQAARQQDVTQCDSEMLKLINVCKSRDQAIKKIEQALFRIDDLQVCTIHSFCQTVLTEEALSACQPFEIETGDGKEILISACQDYWRVFNAEKSESETGRHYLDFIIEYVSTPKQLLSEIHPLLNSNSTVLEHDPLVSSKQLIEQLVACTANMKRVWCAEKENILEQLKSSDISGFGVKTVETISKEFDEFVDNEYLWRPVPGKLPRLTQTYLNDGANLKKNGYRFPDHQFFELCDEYEKLRNKDVDIYVSFLISATSEIRKRMEMKCHNRSYLTYDMLLTRLYDALSRPIYGEKLAASIRQKFNCALIDEFQDTDPIQYKIFDQLYPVDNNRYSLIMIGDPKQAIYGFRGADIYAYLNARTSVDTSCRFTLQKNYRSSKQLVNAINRLFSLSDQPFINSDISYHDVTSDTLMPNEGLLYRSQEMTGNKSGDPLQIFYSSGVESKKEIKRTLFNDMCNQITRLIQDGEEGRVLLNNQALEAGDIAVIVHSHRDIETIRRMLQHRGVGASVYSRESVFNSREAKVMERLLKAILYPEDRSNLSRAATSGLFGSSLKDIQTLTTDGQEWYELTALFTNLHQIWMTYGIHAAIRQLLVNDNGIQALMSVEDGARSVTNLLHISELMSDYELENGSDPHHLMRWCIQNIQNPESNDNHLLRLEDDTEQVKILTIHNSKGLEFPVVFCPTLWDESIKNRSKLISNYHDTTQNNKHITHIGSSSSSTKQKAERLEKTEICAEEARKTYVALTRAKYECRIFWMASKQSHLSGLGSIILGKETIEASLDDKLSTSERDSLTDRTFTSLFEKLNNDPESSIVIHDISENPAPNQLKVDDQLTEQGFTYRNLNLPQHLSPSRNMYSFSSLLLHEDVSGDGVDYDQHSAIGQSTGNLSVPPTFFQFPRGRKAGSFLHKLFEDSRFGFEEPGLPLHYLEELLLNNGYQKKWAPILNQMLFDVTTANYRDLKLNRVSLSDCIREMSFQFPTPHINGHTLLRTIRPESPTRPISKKGEGFLSGFIDLVVKQNGRFYIIDFKSNYLGDSRSDYEKEKLTSAILDAQYDMQYHIYTVALYKYLKNRLVDFDYESQFGGVFYLFLRGINSGSDNGIYFHKPNLENILSLDAYLDRNEQ